MRAMTRRTLVVRLQLLWWAVVALLSVSSTWACQNDNGAYYNCDNNNNNQRQQNNQQQNNQYRNQYQYAQDSQDPNNYQYNANQQRNYYQEGADSQDPNEGNNQQQSTSTVYYGDQYYSQGYPKLGADACYAYQQTNICNPEKILQESDLYNIQSHINTFESVPVYCSNSVVSTQMAVYIEHFTKSHSPEEIAAKLHTDWGLGMETDCGNTGLLVYVPMDGGHVYISRGNALRDSLPDTVLRYVIANMRSYMQNGQYGAAVDYGIVDLTSYLRGEKSNPSYLVYSYTQLTNRVPPQVVCGGALAILLGIVLVCVQGCRTNKKKKLAKIQEIDDQIEEANMYTFEGNDMVVKMTNDGGIMTSQHTTTVDQLNTTIDADADEYYEEAGITHGW